MIVSGLRALFFSVISLIIFHFQNIICEANDFFYQTSTKQPHIIVILADDLGWNDVGFHGSNEIRTPNIDALAYNGVILHRHYSMATCTPSRAALLTGRYPIRLGMQGTPIAAGMRLGIPLNETLLPQYLKRLGYKTSLVGKWHVGCYREDLLPTKRGFDSFFGYYNGYIGYYDGMHIDLGVGGLDARRGDSPAWNELVGKYATEVLTSEASDVIARHNQSQPLFLEVSHLAPHAGNVGGRLQVPNASQTETEFGYIGGSKRRVFAGMVKELDKSVGEIVKALDKAKMLEDSIIVFLSDNGAPTVEPVWGTGNSGSNWPLRGEKASLHEGGIRTAGAIWSTRIARSSTIYKENFHLVDWLPTLYAAAGGDISNLTEIDGVNHWESISGLETNQEIVRPNRTLLLNIDDVEGTAALMLGRWKIIKNNATSKLAFTNGYFGSQGTGLNIPHYNITTVLGSQVGRILSKLNPNPESKMADTFLQLRNRSTIHCPNFTTGIQSGNECYKSECLYDLESDPCESENLLEMFPELGKTMKSLLENFRSQIRPRPTYIFDDASHPKNFNNYWGVWVGTTEQSANGSTNLSQRFLLVLLSLLLSLYIFSYR